MTNYQIVNSADFTVGSVLSRALGVLKQNFMLFFGLALIANIPGVILEIILPENQGSMFVKNFVNMIFSLLIQGAIAYGVYKVLRNQQTSWADAIGRGMSRLLPLILAAILTGVAIFIGIILFIIPGIIISCMLAVTIPVCTIEEQGAIDSMKRSAELTKGYRMRIFGMLFIAYVIIFVITFGIIMIMGQISVIASVLVLFVLISVVQAFMNVMIAMIYYDLRTVKEGVSVDNLAKVFD